MRKTAWVLGLMAVAVALGQSLDPQPDKDGVYSMGKGLTPAMLTHAEPAVYPSDPNLAKVKHVVVLSVVIGADGTPGLINILNAHPSPFDDAAIAAVKASQFAQARLGLEVKPVPMRILLWVPFLGDKSSTAPATVPSIVNRSSMGTSFTPPIPRNWDEAEFAKQMHKEKVQGLVRVHFLVTEDGLPSDIRLITPTGHLIGEKAMKAAEEFRFTPAKLSGVPVPFDLTVEVNLDRY